MSEIASFQRRGRGDVAQRGEMRAVFGENSVRSAVYGRDPVAREVADNARRGPFVQFDYSVLGGAIDCHEPVKLVLGRVHLSKINVRLAERV